MSSQPPYSFLRIGDECNNAFSFQDRFGLCQTKDDSAREDTADRNQWELLMKQVRVELYSSSSDEFNGRAFELRQLACSQEAGFPRKHNNLCDPPVLESAPGYPYYATSSFVPISPIRSSRTTSKSAKVTTDGPSHQSINHFGNTDLENEIRATPLSMDNSVQQAENHQKVRNSGFKKDPTRLATPTELDVLAGRGGETNKHLGNLVFREEARKLRVFYRMKDASRDDKFRLSVELVERIKKKGGRFLGKCDEGLWYVMFDDDARKKAIQGEILAGYFLEPWKID
ncbi:hypothetical protein ACHAXA_008515 [Cyclostephanos tholiformis]|uniref:DUF6824 domain-containing protein n=1 Tax=Cyclostephanos tholiformis TaxID=382380 RepID=A0ABD3RR95_9STRA